MSEIPLVQRCHSFSGRLFGAIDQAHFSTHHFADGALEQRIVRAAKHQRIDFSFREWREVFLRDDTRGLGFQPTLFNEGNEQRTGLDRDPR